ncbi:MAG: hypothetical protein IPH30_10455 [Betaproteobacteria bacterium]|nr:hypothetical protein [Betaproteobacteria bacterium]
METGYGAKLMNSRGGGSLVRAAAFFLAGALAGCAAAGGEPDFEFTGTVYDAVTKQPIEGAYVFASYREPVGVNSRCYKTRGMYTGKDGKYHFPIDSLDGLSPWFTSAIKPGYYFGTFDTPKREVWQRQDASSYADRNLYLIPQDPAKPNLRIGSGEEYCFAARTREDATAAVAFLKIEIVERQRYGATPEAIAAMQEMIHSLEGLPSRDASDSNTTPKGAK